MTTEADGGDDEPEEVDLEAIAGVRGRCRSVEETTLAVPIGSPTGPPPEPGLPSPIPLPAIGPPPPPIDSADSTDITAESYNSTGVYANPLAPPPRKEKAAAPGPGQGAKDNVSDEGEDNGSADAAPAPGRDGSKESLQSTSTPDGSDDDDGDEKRDEGKAVVVIPADEGAADDGSTHTDKNAEPADEGPLTVRQRMRRVLETRACGITLALLILLNTILLAAQHHNQPDWLTEAQDHGNLAFLIIFVSESIFRVVSYGPAKFCEDSFNIFDVVINLMSVVDFVLSEESSGFSAMRAFRLLRMFKLARQIPELWATIQAILLSLRGVWVLTMMLLLVIFVYALLGMQLFGGRFCDLDRTSIFQYDPRTDHCDGVPRANFDALGYALLTVFQIITGEDWNRVMYNGVRATGEWMVLYFVTLFVFGNYVVLSLFVAVLINNSQFHPREDEDAEDEDDGYGAVDSDRTARCFRAAVCNMGEEQQPQRDAAWTEYSDILTELLEDATIEGDYEQELLNSSTLRLLDQDGTAVKPLRLRGWTPDKSSFVPQVTMESGMRLHRTLSRHFARKVHRGLFCLSHNTPIRATIRKVVEHDYFEVMVVLLILLSTVTLAMYNPLAAPDEEITVVLFHIDLSLVVCFAFEAFLKIVAYGFVLHPGAYLRRDPWDRLDFAIVVLSIASYVVPGVSNFSTARMIRTLRPLRFINKSSGMKLVIGVLLSSLYPLMHIGMVTGLIFGIYAILGVHLFGGRFYACTDAVWGDVSYQTVGAVTTEAECLAAGYRWENSRSHFDHLGAAFLTLFETSTLEGWVHVMQLTMDARAPGTAPDKNSQPFYALYLCCWIVLGSFFIVNLFIGVLIDHYSYAKYQLDKQKGTELTEEQQLWVDVQELVTGFTRKQVKKDHLKNPVSRKLRLIVSNRIFERIMCGVICVNVIIMGTEHAGQDDNYETFLETANLSFVGLYLVEALAKIAAYGRSYFDDPWDRFDFAVVCVSTTSVLLAPLVGGYSAMVAMMRVLRLCRLGRVMKMASGVHHLIRTLWLSLPNLVNVAGLLSLLYFLYAVTGMNFFGRISTGECVHSHSNFHSFGYSMLLLFRVSTGESWQCLLADYRATDEPHCDPQLDSCGGESATAFFVSFVVIVMYTVLNILIAVILSGYDTAKEEQEALLTANELESFWQEWTRKAEPNDQWKMRSHQLPVLLKTIGAPLGLERAVSELAFDIRERNREKMAAVGRVVYEEHGLVSFCFVVEALIDVVWVRVGEEGWACLHEVALPHEVAKEFQQWGAHMTHREKIFHEKVEMFKKRWASMFPKELRWTWDSCTTPRGSPKNGRVRAVSFDRDRNESPRRRVTRDSATFFPVERTFAALKIQNIWRGKLARRRVDRVSIDAAATPAANPRAPSPGPLPPLSAAPPVKPEPSTSRVSSPVSSPPVSPNGRGDDAGAVGGNLSPKHALDHGLSMRSGFRGGDRLSADMLDAAAPGERQKRGSVSSRRSITNFTELVRHASNLSTASRFKNRWGGEEESDGTFSNGPSLRGGSFLRKNFGSNLRGGRSSRLAKVSMPMVGGRRLERAPAAADDDRSYAASRASFASQNLPDGPDVLDPATWAMDDWADVQSMMSQSDAGSQQSGCNRSHRSHSRGSGAGSGLRRVDSTLSSKSGQSGRSNPSCKIVTISGSGRQGSMGGAMWVPKPPRSRAGLAGQPRRPSVSGRARVPFPVDIEGLDPKQRQQSVDSTGARLTHDNRSRVSQLSCLSADVDPSDGERSSRAVSSASGLSVPGLARPQARRSLKSGRSSPDRLSASLPPGSDGDEQDAGE